jgi:teichuronic acid biosynthesis glycosyltransferase TuaG
VEKYLVSIITPSFNCIDYIEDTYKCIKQQSHTNWEWLVTDDCSTDGTYDSLIRFSKLDCRIKIFRNDINSGAAVSRNNSLKNASGDFIAFIDSDDLWVKEKLSIQINYMVSKKASFSFTGYELINDDTTSRGVVVDINQFDLIGYEDMLRKKATMGCSTVMLFSGGFDIIQMPLLRTGQDYALWLELLKTGSLAHPIREVLTQYRILPNSISRNKFKKALRQWEIYRNVERLSFLKSFECFCYYAWRAVFRK